MASSIPVVPASLDGATSAATEAAPVLDAEKLVAYRLALELQVFIAPLLPAQHRVLADQLERAPR